MKIFSSLIFFCLTFSLSAAETDLKQSAADALTESNIAQISARMLEQIHYSQQPLNDDISSKWLDRYIDSLDALHLHFLQGDLEEFETYRTRLDDLTLKTGDTHPAHFIFQRMLERVSQRATYVNGLLKTEKFEFTGKDRYTPDRRKLPRAKNLEEAHQLWRQHLRSEFLQEKLSLTSTNKALTVKEKTDTKIDKAPNAVRTPDKTVLPQKADSDGIVWHDGKTTNSAIVTPKSSTNTLTETEEIIKKISKRYANLEKTLKDFSDDEVLEFYLNALARVYDPHSDYMGRSHFENFSISMKLQLFGIGALLSSEDGYCKIKELMPGPAMESKKIKPGDRIVAVAQGSGEPVDVVDMKLNKVVELIRGPKGTEVRLTIWPGDAPDFSTRKTVTLIRDVIKLENQEAKAKVIEMPQGKETMRLGVIDLPSFYANNEGEKTEFKSTTADIAKLLKKLNQEKVSGVILDLRRNGGGLLDEAISLTGLFITNGPVVQVKDPGGEIITLSDPDSSVLYKGPLIILTSRFSASASEILAGALQDYGRALIVGDSSTFGKGTVQRLLKLNPYMDQRKLTYSYDPGALKPTTAKFYRAGGASTQLRGVVPDLRLPTVVDYAEIGEAALENPLPWDEVSSANFTKWSLVKPYLAELQKRSEQRLKKDKDFAYIYEDIEEFKKNLADKSVSLNEQTRRTEKKEIEARNEARKKERLARNQPEPKIFEVTLKNAEQPGLQPYIPKTNDLASAKSETHSSEIDEEAELDEKSPASDPVLSETERILLDYISLLAKGDKALSKAR